MVDRRRIAREGGIGGRGRRQRFRQGARRYRINGRFVTKEAWEAKEEARRLAAQTEPAGRARGASEMRERWEAEAARMERVEEEERMRAEGEELSDGGGGDGNDDDDDLYGA